MSTLAFLQNIGGWEWLIVGGIALLIFGKRLPEVGRSVGKSIVEFRKGLKGIEDDIEIQASKPAQRSDPAALPDASRTMQPEPIDPARRVARDDALTQ